MSHEASVKRFLKSNAFRSRWVELGDALWVTNGSAAIRIIEPPTIAWIKAAYETDAGLLSLADIIERTRIESATPTDVMVDPTGITCRVFAIGYDPAQPTNLVPVSVKLLEPWCGKTTSAALSSLTWRYGNNAVSGWSGDDCQIVVMELFIQGTTVMLNAREMLYRLRAVTP